ncbi:MAG: AAA family ATPase [Candidatus Sabulitectum sp.]|nr:AAA family ATPase [Candidatus Sabulitectum sp.]
MKRTIETDLQHWKNQASRKPLLLRGVRQSGKTYLLKELFGPSFPKVHYFDLEQNLAAATIFNRDSLKSTELVKALELISQDTINIYSDLIILDEIQASPRALTSLKYFAQEMPEAYIAATGSLLGVSLGKASFPVGKVDFLDVNPMSFTEFLEGMGEHRTNSILKDLIFEKSLDEFYHNRLWGLFSEYLSVGGMPEAVNCYKDLRGKSVFHATEEVSKIMNNLVNGYLADVAKHSGNENSMHIAEILRNIPAQLGRETDGNAERFRFKGIIPGKVRYSDLAGAINWLVASSILLKVPIANRGEQPLSAWESYNRFKLYLHDIGVLSHLAEMPLLKTDAFLPGFYKGWVAENFVAQELTASGISQLHSWQAGKSAVEFVLQSDGISIPVEVKAGRRTQAKSVGVFAKKHSSPLVIKLGFWTNSLTDRNRPTLNLPLYAAGLLADRNRIKSCFNGI